jgi:hypothetical protein
MQEGQPHQVRHKDQYTAVLQITILEVEPQHLLPEIRAVLQVEVRHQVTTVEVLQIQAHQWAVVEVLQVAAVHQQEAAVVLQVEVVEEAAEEADRFYYKYTHLAGYTT